MKVYIIIALVYVALCGDVKWVEEAEFNQVAAIKYRTKENIIECLKAHPTTNALLGEFIDVFNSPKLEEINNLVSKVTKEGKAILEQCSKEPKVTSFEKHSENEKCVVRCRRVGELICTQKCQNK